VENLALMGPIEKSAKNAAGRFDPQESWAKP